MAISLSLHHMHPSVDSSKGGACLERLPHHLWPDCPAYCLDPPPFGLLFIASLSPQQPPTTVPANCRVSGCKCEPTLSVLQKQDPTALLASSRQHLAKANKVSYG